MTIASSPVDYPLTRFDYSVLDHALQNLQSNAVADLCALPCKIIGANNDAVCNTREQLLVRINEVFDAYKGLDYTRIHFACADTEHLVADLMVACGTFVISLRSGVEILAFSTLMLKRIKNDWKLVSVEVLDISVPSSGNAAEND